MTPLELVGIAALTWASGRLLGKLFPFEKQPPKTVALDVAVKQMNTAIEEAFQSGMLCAADMVTHSGHEELAGHIRKTVQYVRAANDN